MIIIVTLLGPALPKQKKAVIHLSTAETNGKTHQNIGIVHSIGPLIYFFCFVSFGKEL